MSRVTGLGIFERTEAAWSDPNKSLLWAIGADIWAFVKGPMAPPLSKKQVVVLPPLEPVVDDTELELPEFFPQHSDGDIEWYGAIYDPTDYVKWRLKNEHLREKELLFLRSILLSYIEAAPINEDEKKPLVTRSLPDQAVSDSWVDLGEKQADKPVIPNVTSIEELGVFIQSSSIVLKCRQAIIPLILDIEKRLSTDASVTSITDDWSDGMELNVDQLSNLFFQTNVALEKEVTWSKLLFAKQLIRFFFDEAKDTITDAQRAQINEITRECNENWHWTIDDYVKWVTRVSEILNAAS